MVDFEIVGFEEIGEGKAWNKILFDNYPSVIFQGAGFEFDNENKRIRNLLHDLINRGTEATEGDLMGLTRMHVSITLHDQIISLRFFISRIVGSMIANNSWTSEDVLEEIGPRMDLKVRRKQLASEEDYKLAISRKSYLTQKAKKNIELNNMGDRMGRVHVKQADLKTLEIRKYRRYVEKGKREISKEKESKELPEQEELGKPKKMLKTD